MRKDKARAVAICALIDDAIKHGYPKTYKGRMFMDTAIRWLQEDRHLSSTSTKPEPIGDLYRHSFEQ